MNAIVEVQPYRATLSTDTLSKWNGVVRVWSEPTNILQGAKVVDEIKEPMPVTALEEQKDIFGALTQRVKIKYGKGREGWVIYEAIVLK